MGNKAYDKYKNFVYQKCLPSEGPDGKDVEYWKNYLFANTMIFVIPLSLITLIPGVWFCLLNELYLLAIFDICSFTVLVLVIFATRISIHNRKLLFLFNTYLVAAFLLLYSGAPGPGLIMLYAGTVFGLLIESDKYAYWWSFLNLFIIGGFALVLYFNLSPVPTVNEFDAMEWIAIAVNLVFISFLSSALIPRLFFGLSETINSHNKTRNMLAENLYEKEILLSQLESKNEDLEQFAYVASHDLQEPLRMVSSFMGQLEKKYSDQLDDKAHEYINFATDGAKRMSLIIKDLLEYSRAGRIGGKKVMVPLRSMLDDYHLLRKGLVEDKKAVISAGDLPIVRTYLTPLHQVFNNLLDNALKYSKADQHAEVKVDCRDTGSFWEVSINDNGIGIEKGNIQKIFTIFHRGSPITETKGTGLGLAIVKKIIERMGGEIWVESIPAVGSTFYFTIPK